MLRLDEWKVDGCRQCQSVKDSTAWHHRLMKRSGRLAIAAALAGLLAGMFFWVNRDGYDTLAGLGCIALTLIFLVILAYDQFVLYQAKEDEESVELICQPDETKHVHFARDVHNLDRFEQLVNDQLTPMLPWTIIFLLSKPESAKLMVVETTFKRQAVTDWRVSIEHHLAGVHFTDRFGAKSVWRNTMYNCGTTEHMVFRLSAAVKDVTSACCLAELQIRGREDTTALRATILRFLAVRQFIQETDAVDRRGGPIPEVHALTHRGISEVAPLIRLRLDSLEDEVAAYLETNRQKLGLTYGPRQGGEHVQQAT